MKKQLALLGVAMMIALSGCGKGNVNENTSGNMHSGMNHSSSGEVPAGLKEANNPAFKVGSEAIITANHMEGMNGAKATVVGAYDTTAYSISYTPTTAGERVKDHKWVIQEEIEGASEQPYKVGDEVVIQADHMKGMNGAKATIDSAQQTVVYMLDYVPATGGEPVKNHKWVTESELSTP